MSPTNETTKEIYKDQLFDANTLHDRSFVDCQFQNCRFDKANLTGSTFSDCQFNHCEITLPNLMNCGFRGATFTECKLIGVDFTKGDPSFFRLAFERCLIDTCNFSSLKLKSTTFVRSTIRESRFIQTTLNEANFDGTDLEHTLFHECDLEKASFVNARNYTINPTTNKVKGATFSLPEAVSLLSNLGITLV